MPARDFDILVCDKEVCVYTERSAARLASAKYSGIPRCIKHGALLLPRAWAYGKSPREVRIRLKQANHASPKEQSL